MVFFLYLFIFTFRSFLFFFFFFFNDTATTEIYTLSLHDALSICRDISAQVDRVAQLTQTGEQWRDLSAHLQSQIEAERARIAQDIHDELGAALTAIRMEL